MVPSRTTLDDFTSSVEQQFSSYQSRALASEQTTVANRVYGGPSFKSGPRPIRILDRFRTDSWGMLDWKNVG